MGQHWQTSLAIATQFHEPRVLPLGHRHLDGQQIDLAFEIGQHKLRIRPAGHVSVKSLRRPVLCGGGDRSGPLQIVQLLVDRFKLIDRPAIGVSQEIQAQHEADQERS